MNVRNHGDGKPLVLLHSLLADSSSFEGLIAKLATERRVLTVDLPGYRGVPRSTDAVPAVALGVAQALRDAGLGDGFDLLGNGYGGFVALSLAQQLPSRVDRLVLLDSAACFPPAGKAGVQAMKDAVLSGGMPGLIDIALERLFPVEFRQGHPDVLATCRDALLGMDRDAFASTCQNLIEVDLRPGLHLVTAETLVIVGLEDKATPLPLAREVAQGIAGARLHELPDCGHVPHIQMPDMTASLLRTFLN
jgi:3-oxoadipate enol-lactonase